MTYYRIQRTKLHIAIDRAGHYRGLFEATDHGDAILIDRLDAIADGSIHHTDRTLHVDANVIADLVGYLHERYPNEGGKKLRSRLDRMFAGSVEWPAMLRGVVCAMYPEAATPGDVAYYRTRAAAQLGS